MGLCVAKNSMNIDISLKDLLEAGCHFGHQARRWNPRMKPYLFAKRDGLHVFDLVKTKEGLEEACKAMYEASKDGKRIVLVATKRQAQDIVRDTAKMVGVGYITERWLGGMLTNYDQMKQSVKKLKRMKKDQEMGLLGKYTKKEQLLMTRQMAKSDKFLGGLMVYDEKPEVLFVVDTRREVVAINEARNLGMQVIGLVDSNSDPEQIDIVIPANDDAVKSIQYVVSKIAEAIVQGKNARVAGEKDSKKDDNKVAEKEEKVFKDKKVVKNKEE